MFTSAVIAPLTAELAAISRSIDGVGCKSVYFAAVTELMNILQMPTYTVHSTSSTELDLLVSLSIQRAMDNVS